MKLRPITQRDAHDRLEVRRHGRGDGVETDARPVEHGLDEHRCPRASSRSAARSSPGSGSSRSCSAYLRDDAELGHALGARVDDVVLLQGLEHLGAVDPHDRGERREAQGDRRQDRVGRARRRGRRPLACPGARRRPAGASPAPAGCRHDAEAPAERQAARAGGPAGAAASARARSAGSAMPETETTRVSWSIQVSR